MVRPAMFDSDEILDAALEMAAECGLRATTVSGVRRRLGASSGSMYHRFPTRSHLRAELWIRTAERFQEGYLRELRQPDAGVAAAAAALFVPAFARIRPDEARLLLDPPEDVTQLDDRARRLEARLDEELREFAEWTGLADHGSAGRRRLRFALIDAPYAAVRPSLTARVPIPADVDDLVRETVRAVLPLAW